MRPRLLLFALLCATVLARPASAQDRGGFTLLTTIGYGLQSSGEFVVNDYISNDSRSYGGDTYSALAGMNFGIGGFVSKDTALMARFSGTAFTAKYLNSGRSEDETVITSGVVVLGVQHWRTERFNWEAGVGYGVYTTEHIDEVGLGLMVGAAYSFYQHKKLSLQVGVEDALYTGHIQTVNNLGFCFGIQLL